MKAIGGYQHQLMGMYLALVLVLGGLAFLVAVGPAALGGVLIWLLLALLIAALASGLPAWNAMRLTVREVLSYE